MVYAKEIQNGSVVGLYTYDFEPHFDDGSGMAIITEDEYTKLLFELFPTATDTDQISDSEALAIITGEVIGDDA